MEKNFPRFRGNPYLDRLDGNKRLAFKLIDKKRYRTVRLLFRLKNKLG